MFLLNSRGHPLSEADPSSERKALHQNRRTFSRSYGTILPSSFTRVISRALVFSTCLPVLVYGTVFVCLTLEAFLGSMAPVASLLFQVTPHRISELSARIFLSQLPTCLNQLFQQLAYLAFSVTPSKHTKVQEF